MKPKALTELKKPICSYSQTGLRYLYLKETVTVAWDGFFEFSYSKVREGCVIGSYDYCTARKIPFMYSFSRNCTASVPIPTFMCLLAIYIFPGSVHIFFCSRIGRPILEINESLTDMWVYIILIWNNSFISGNTSMGTRHLYWIITGPSFAVCPLKGKASDLQQKVRKWLTDIYKYLYKAYLTKKYKICYQYFLHFPGRCVWPDHTFLLGIEAGRSTYRGSRGIQGIPGESRGIQGTQGGPGASKASQGSPGVCKFVPGVEVWMLRSSWKIQWCPLPTRSLQTPGC
jgi:hypothetical protein